MWQHFIDTVASPQAPIWFCLFIGFIFLFAMADVWVRTSGLTHVIRRGMQIVGATDGPRGFFRDYEALREHFVREPVFEGAWKEFDKTLVMDRNHEVVMMTRRPHEFFHEVSLLSPRINVRLAQALPGYLISLGLFFTFIGLVASISIAANGLSGSGKMEVMQQALVQLLQVASLKFICSVAGISLSLMLSAFQKMLFNNVSMMTYKFCSLMESRTQLITVEQLMFDWISAQHETTRKFQHMADDIASEVALKLVQPEPAA